MNASGGRVGPVGCPGMGEGATGMRGKVTERLRFLLCSPARRRGSLEGGSGLLDFEVV